MTKNAMTVRKRGEKRRKMRERRSRLRNPKRLRKARTNNRHKNGLRRDFFFLSMAPGVLLVSTSSPRLFLQLAWTNTDFV